VIITTFYFLFWGPSWLRETFCGSPALPTLAAMLVLPPLAKTSLRIRLVCKREWRVG
jgi:hypothetical protein